MKAIQLQNSFGIENLKLVDLPELTPKAGEILVRIKAASLNYRDYLMVTGRYNPKQKLPLIPLSDSAGEVVAVGEGVTKWKVGDRVMGIFSQSWLYGSPTRSTLKSTLGGPLDGTLSEYRIFPEHGVVATPEHLTDLEAATLPCAALTAYNALFPLGNIGPADTVVILGTGGVSIFALQFAKILGARVILTSSDDAKLQRARELGADEIINYKEEPNWEKEVLKLTDMKGADLVVEVGGAGTLPKSIACTRPGGTVSLIGVLAGGESNLSLLPVLMQGIRIQGVIVGSRQDFENMNRVIIAHKLKPVISEVFSFEKAPESIAHLKDGKHFGKICIEIT